MPRSSAAGHFTKITPENPVPWTAMKCVSARGRKINFKEMLKQVQHDSKKGISHS
jgi:hypothetical protein